MLDPFAGSGSTAVAAVVSGRRAVLIESDPKWIEMAIERTKIAEQIADSIMDV